MVLLLIHEVYGRMKKIFKKFLTTLFRLFKRVASVLVGVLCKREYNTQKFIGFNERSTEFAFLFDKISKYQPKTVLDVGTGMTALPHMMRSCGLVVTAIDNIKDYWDFGMYNRHFYVINDDITKTKLTEKFDMITCISVLEHIVDHKEAMKSMYKLLKPGGFLVLTCPYTEDKYVANVYELDKSPIDYKSFSFITQSFSKKELDGWLSESYFELSEQEYWRYYKGEAWTCGEKLERPVKVGKNELHQLSLMILKK